MSVRQLFREFFQPNGVDLKLGLLTIKYSDATRDEAARVVAAISSKRVLFAGVDDEIWEHVLDSLKKIQQELVSIHGTFLRRGPPEIRDGLSDLIRAIATYLAAYEADYLRFMAGPLASGLAAVHKERNWPSLGDAAEDLIQLRQILAQGIQSLTAFAGGNTPAISLGDGVPARHWARYARQRELCNACGWDLSYFRTQCPYSRSDCPSFTNDKSTFQLTRYGPLKVELSGSFNDWNRIALIQYLYGHWGIRIPLQKGTYHYKFVVDGEWQLDPGNPDIANDANGNQNSVIVVS